MEKVKVKHEMKNFFEEEQQSSLRSCNM